MSPAGSKNAPEAKAREKIDALLAQAGWLVQYREDMNLTASNGIAVREFKLEKGHGYVDYLLFVDGHALGVVEAKPAGYSFTSVEVQAKKYVEGLPKSLRSSGSAMAIPWRGTSTSGRACVPAQTGSSRRPGVPRVRRPWESPSASAPRAISVSVLPATWAAGWDPAKTP